MCSARYSKKNNQGMYARLRLQGGRVIMPGKFELAYGARLRTGTPKVNHAVWHRQPRCQAWVRYKRCLQVRLQLTIQQCLPRHGSSWVVWEGCLLGKACCY